MFAQGPVSGASGGGEEVRIAIIGGTGFIGRALVGELVGAGHEMTLLVRPKPGRVAGPDLSRPGVTLVPFDGRPSGEWVAALEGIDGVANLAGESIGARWTKERKERIRASRVDLTRTLVEVLGGLARKPSVLVNASGLGYFGDAGEELLTEEHAPGGDWLARVASDWEAAALDAEALGIRAVSVRTGIVFGPGAESLDILALPIRMFVGGPLGSGRQWFPWIHLDDIVGIYRFALEDEMVRGPVNAAAGSIRERDLARAVGRMLHRPLWLPAPVFGVRLLYGEFADALVASQRVSNAKIIGLGYVFVWPELAPALAHALAAGR